MILKSCNFVIWSKGCKLREAQNNGDLIVVLLLMRVWLKFQSKTSSAEKNRGLEDFTAKPMAWGNQAKAELKRGNLDFKGNQGDGSKHNKVAMRLNTHPTVKPQELMKYLCRLVTPKGGVVLDPFMGSGSTGMAAKDEGFDFIGIEKEQEYFEIAEARIKVSSPLMEFM